VPCAKSEELPEKSAAAIRQKHSLPMTAACAMCFEITVISFLVCVLGAICARELFLAQPIPRSVYYRGPAILRLELRQVLTAAAFEMAIPGSGTPPYLHRTVLSHRSLYIREKQRHAWKKATSKAILRFVCVANLRRRSGFSSGQDLNRFIQSDDSVERSRATASAGEMGTA
jgi:hypothetical protein